MIKKLDVGIEILKDIKGDTSFVAEQREHNQRMKEYNQRLEKRAKKLIDGVE